MQDITPAQHQTPQIEPKQLKKRRIPRKIGEVVRLLVTGECKTVVAAANRVGMHPNYVYGALKKPEIMAHLEQMTRVSLAQMQAPAAATLARLLEHAQSEHVQKDVAVHVLAINGHKPKNDSQVSVNVDIKAGFVIDLSEDKPKPAIDVQAHE